MYITLTGGEPLLRKEVLIELTKFLNEHSVQTGVATNGSLVDESFAKTISKLNISLGLSLDGPDAATHDRGRGVPGAFNQVIKATRLLKAHGVPFLINHLVTSNNVDRFFETYGLAADLGASSFGFLYPVPCGRADTKTVPPWNKWRDLIVKMTDLIKDPPIPLLLCDVPWAYLLPLKNQRDEWKHWPIQRIPYLKGMCPAGNYTVALSPEGDLYPCDLLAWDPSFICGNLLQHSFEDIWFGSSILQHIRNAKREWDEPCSTCEINDICAGGCRAAAAGVFRNLYAPDPRCPRVMNRFEEFKRNRLEQPRTTIRKTKKKHTITSGTVKIHNEMFRYVSNGKTVRIMVAMPYFMVLDTVSFEILQLSEQKIDHKQIISQIKKKYGWREEIIKQAIQNLHDVVTRFAALKPVFPQVNQS